MSGGYTFGGFKEFHGRLIHVGVIIFGTSDFVQEGMWICRCLGRLLGAGSYWSRFPGFTYPQVVRCPISRRMGSSTERAQNAQQKADNRISTPMGQNCC